MNLYNTSEALFIEAEEGEDVVCNWWLDQTLNLVVRYDTDTGLTTTFQRYPEPPKIITWMSPVTFEDEQRMCSKWRITEKDDRYSATFDVNLPINNRKYTIKERIRYSR